jgi:hypothetical protein
MYSKTTNLLGFGVGNFLDVNPIRGFLVLRVIDLLWRVDSGGEFFEKATAAFLFSVYLNDVGIIWTE